MKSLEKVCFSQLVVFMTLSATMFSSCNASDDSITEPKENLVEFKKELVDFSNKQGSLMVTLLAQNNDEDEFIMNDIKKNLDIISNKYESILDQNTRSTLLTEDEIEIFKMDSQELLTYLQGKVSPQMYQMCVGIFEEDTFYLDLNEIFNKYDFTPNEMFALANMAVYINNNKMETTRSIEDKCSDQYSSDRTVCGVEYLASCALSCAGGPELATAGVLFATYQLDKCLDSAHDKLVCCRQHK